MSKVEEFAIKDGVLTKYRRKRRYVIIPDGVTSIGEEAFYFNENLKSVVIPDGVTSIGNSAFCFCSNLQSVTIPSSVSSIGAKAFSRCGKLESITIPNGVTSIGSYAFEECNSLINITIPDSVTSIGEFAFYLCSNLKSIAIPDSVTNLDFGAFAGCESLESIVLEPSNTRYKFQNNCLIDIANNSVIWGCQNSVIPNSVTSIGDHAFESCRSLRSLTIPDSVTSIGDFAFVSCRNLASITISDSVTSIGSYAFDYCSSLKNISIENVSTIKENAFCKCEKLKSIVLNMEEIGAHAFAYCTELSSVILHNTKIIRSCAFYRCSQLKNIDLPTGLVEIGEYAFSECGLKEVVVPKTVLKTANESFSGCPTITIFDTIDPDAKPADEHLDNVRGNPNSVVGFIGIGRSYSNWQLASNHSWVDHEIIVRSAQTDEIKYKVWMGADPTQKKYYSTLTSSWGKNATFNFAALDAAFPTIRGVNHKIKVALNRLRYPEGLSDATRDSYIAYLVKFAKDLVAICIDSNDLEALLYCEPFGVIQQSNIDYMLDCAAKAKAVQFSAYLMEYKADHWGFSTTQKSSLTLK